MELRGLVAGGRHPIPDSKSIPAGKHGTGRLTYSTLPDPSLCDRETRGRESARLVIGRRHWR
jgi:hypothetical protein